MEDKSGNNIGFGKFIWGLLIILVGVIFLGINLGWWQNNIWSLVWMFWPIILILIGIRFFIKNDYFLVMIVLIIIVLAIILGRSNVGGIKDQVWSKLDNTVSTQNFTNPRNQEVSEIGYEINLGAMNVNVTALDPQSVEQYKGNFKSTNGIDITNEIVADKQTVIFSEKPANFLTTQGVREFNLEVSPNKASTFRINSGASTLDLDFTNVILQKLSIDSGASSGKVKIGSKSSTTDLSINAGASSFNILVPQETRLWIESDSALLSKNFDQLGLEKKDGDYKSADYDSSLAKIHLEVSAGVSNILIEKY